LFLSVVTAARFIVSNDQDAEVVGQSRHACIRWQLRSGMNVLDVVVSTLGSEERQSIPAEQL
jgi:hypothetical protein